MAAGFKSGFPWLGLSAPDVAVQGGYKTPLPGWNAGAISGPVQGGYKGLLGFWIGGSSAGAAIEQATIRGSMLAARHVRRCMRRR